MKSLADDPIIMNEHSPHHWIGRNMACTKCGEVDAAMHIVFWTHRKKGNWQVCQKNSRKGIFKCKCFKFVA